MTTVHLTTDLPHQAGDKLYVVSGRVPGDDEDMTFLLCAEDEEAARKKFTEAMAHTRGMEVNEMIGACCLPLGEEGLYITCVTEVGEVREQEPVAWLAKTLKGSLAGTLGLVRPYNKLNPELYEGPFPVFRHADPGEVEQLRRRLHAARVALEARARTFDGLRAQLAEAQTLLREWAEMFAGGIKASPLEGLETRTLQHLSASAEPKCGKCHGRGLLRIATVCGPADKICPDCASAEPKPFRTPDCPECACVQDGDCLCIPSKPSASVETDVFCEGQWWLAELDGLVESGTHDQKRAVAVVRNMMGQLAKALAEQEPKA